MSILSAVLLGVIQGVAEFLPISSSGHLAIAQNLLGLKIEGSTDNTFDILLHLGTLIAVFIAYWPDIKDMIREFFLGIHDLAKGTTPTPVPRPTTTPQPSMAADEPETGEDIFVFPTAIPEGGAATGPIYEELPEDIWAEG